MAVSCVRVRVLFTSGACFFRREMIIKGACGRGRDQVAGEKRVRCWQCIPLWLQSGLKSGGDGESGPRLCTPGLKSFLCPHSPLTARVAVVCARVV